MPSSRQSSSSSSALVAAVEPEHGVGDLAVDVLDRGAHALAAVALAAVAQLDGLVGAGAGAARHGRPAAGAAEQLDLDLDGGVAAGVEDLPADDFDDLAHLGSPATHPPAPVATPL